MREKILSRVTPSRSTLRVTALVSILLVATLAAPISFVPPGSDEHVQTVGTAEAADGTYGNVIEMASTFFVGTSWLPNINEDTYSQLNQTDALETKLDIHANARIVQTKNEETFAVVDNYLTDSRNIAWIKAKTAIIEELNSGGTASSAKTRAKTAIRDYYAQKQLNMIEQWNSTLSSYEYQKSLVRNHSNVADDYVRFNYEFDAPVSFDHYLSEDQIGLVNGSTHGVKTYYVLTGTYTPDSWASSWNGSHHIKPDYTTIPESEFTIDHGSDGNNHETWYGGFEVQAPDSDYEKIKHINFTQFGTRWSEMVTQKNQMVDNVDPFVDSVYNEYMQNEINISDLHDPYTLASEYTSEYNETGWYAYAVAQNALLGVDTPNLNSTSMMNVTLNDAVNYDGLVMGNLSAYNDSLEVGQTYQFPVDGTFQLVTFNGEIIDLAGQNLTINHATDRAGETVEVIEYRDYNYQTANSTQLQEQLEQINELQAEIQDLEEQLRAGGGGLPDLGNLGPKALGLILVGAAVLIGRKP